MIIKVTAQEVMARLFLKEGQMRGILMQPEEVKELCYYLRHTRDRMQEMEQIALMVGKWVATKEAPTQE